MPTFTKSKPKLLPPEGVVKAQITRVDQGRSSKKDIPFFQLHLRELESGIEFKDTLYFTENTQWKMEALCRSAGLSLPDGEEYKLTTDDLVDRVVYGPLKHRKIPNSGKLSAEFGSFWSREYALEKNPDLQEIPDPENTPEPATLAGSKAKGKTLTPAESAAEALGL